MQQDVMVRAEMEHGIAMGIGGGAGDDRSSRDRMRGIADLDVIACRGEIRDRIVSRVGSGYDERDLAAAALEIVGAGAADETVVAAAAEQVIVARSADERIVAEIAEQHVDPR